MRSGTAAMQTNNQTNRIRPRRGFAAVEAIAVCLLVTFITALSVPAVRQARDDARQWLCRHKNHMSNQSAANEIESQLLPVQSLSSSNGVDSGLPEMILDSRPRESKAFEVSMPVAEQAGVPFCADHTEMTFQVNGQSVTMLLGEAQLCGGCVP
ncbi:MAG: hypothetical protein ACK50J_03225 [Planctomyces sp.]